MLFPLYINGITLLVVEIDQCESRKLKWWSELGGDNSDCMQLSMNHFKFNNVQVQSLLEMMNRILELNVSLVTYFNWSCIQASRAILIKTKLNFSTNNEA